MTIQRERAILLGEALQAFYQYVYKHYKKKEFLFLQDKLFTLKCLLEEHRFVLIGKEIIRINQFMWMEKETVPLIQRVKNSLAVIEDFVEYYKDELFLFLPRIFTIKNLLETMEGNK